MKTAVQNLTQCKAPTCLKGFIMLQKSEGDLQILPCHHKWLVFSTNNREFEATLPHTEDKSKLRSTLSCMDKKNTVKFFSLLLFITFSPQNIYRIRAQGNIVLLSKSYTEFALQHKTVILFRVASRPNARGTKSPTAS